MPKDVRLSSIDELKQPTLRFGRLGNTMTSPKGRALRAGWGNKAIATIVLVSFVAQPFAVPLARAADSDVEKPTRLTAVPVDDDIQASVDHVKAAVTDKGAAVAARGTSNSKAHSPASELTDDARTAIREREGGQENLAVLSLPTSGAKPATASPTLSLPQGAGKVRGMGESFSAELSTGIATYGVPFQLLEARGAAQPKLGLSYSSSGGHGVAGVGWGAGVPSISRQIDRGIPRYLDPAPGGPWTADQDRFVFGTVELVPICLVDGSTCGATLPAGETMPRWASGWQYFRPRVEGAFQRFFWSPDHRTWRIQDKSGTSMELGVPLDRLSDVSGLEIDDAHPSRIFSWHLVRQYDAQGTANPESAGVPMPSNPIIYQYASVDGTSYLTDIFDTSPASAPTSTSFGSFAHHTRLAYEPRPDVTTSYRRGWAVRSSLRLKHVDITSHNFSGTSPTRELVRRYHLSYDGASHVSLLTSVTLEGRCETSVTENSSGVLVDGTSCPRLPAMAFEYQHVAGYSMEGQPEAGDLPGFEGFDERVRTYTTSAPHSIDEALTELFDINSDGLPDVLVTAPERFEGKHGVFFNSAAGQRDRFTSATLMGVQGVVGDSANVLKLSNPNVSSHDLDGDGTVNLLHMPMVKTYSVYSPLHLPEGWVWQGRAIETASHQSATIDFGHRNEELRTADVNADGFVDIVYSSGTQYETFFSLGRYPGGDGQFGSAHWTGASSAEIVNDPVTSCLPWSATPVRFSDPDVRIVDMNGDGFPDVVRVRPGEVRYWPGRGNGYWGTGDPGTCPAGTFGEGRDIAMSESPQFGIVGDDALLMNDVNGDGLSDLVRVHHQAVSIYLNVDGVSWTSRHLITNSPPNGTVTNRVRLTDINGSGTPDLLWGDAFAYKYIDLAGGKRPWLLTKASNGLGRTTEFEYATSVDQMLAAEAAGQEWESKSPTVLHMVSRIIDRDHLEVVGRPAGVYTTEYTYRDPVYDGRQREFRGFRSVRARTVGDANSPTSITTSSFLLGECRTAGANPDACSAGDRWRDNPKEALKGLPLVVETLDEAGTYLSTAHTSYRLRTLYAGLDGREVRHAFAVATDAYRYDTAPFSPASSTLTLEDVQVETIAGTVSTDLSSEITRRSGSATRVRVHQETTVDRFGNTTAQADFGCTENCGSGDEIITKRTEYSRPSVGSDGEPSGWLFRPDHEWVEGSSNAGVRRNETRHHYMLNGLLDSSEALLSGTLLLDRFHETASRAVADPPATAAADGWNTLVSYQYDDFGNVTSEEHPGAVRRGQSYDAPYAELLTTESIGAGAFEPYFPQYYIIKEAVYDRGLQSLTTLVDNYWAASTIGYDAFGRLSVIRKPDPDTYGPSSVPSVRIAYDLPGDATATPYSRVHVEMQDGTSATTETFAEAWSYIDGLGRTIVTLEEADTSAGDLGSWVAEDFTDYDAKGASSRSYLSFFYSGDPSSFPLAQPVTTASTRQRYDAFGRTVQAFGLDGSMTVQTRYHALSADAWDAADLEPGPHAGTPTTTRSDGHGRPVSVAARIHRGSQVEEHETRTTYLPTGEPITITRSGGGLDDVVRWFRYDSLGHMVLNVDPNTTKTFNASPTTDPGTMKAWRYAYDIHGKLVGTSDPRGCGVNYQYLIDGRLAGEDYSPCLDAHPIYSSPDFGNGDGLEVFNLYDLPDPDAASIPDFAFPPNVYDPFGPLWGKLVSTTDRGQKTIFRYDGRGRTTGVAKRIAKPGEPLPFVADRYAPHWYVQATTYDGQDRPTVQSTGADVQALLGTNDVSHVTTEYSQRGTVKRVHSSYDGVVDDGTLAGAITRDADGLVQQITYGDVARTSTHFQYDQRRRLASVQTDRGPPSLWSASPAAYTPAPPAPSAPPSTLQLVLEDSSFAYDVANNPVEMRDWRSPLDWPAGAKPVTKKAVYDDFYRLARLDYQYSDGDDDWTSPFAAENAGGGSGEKPSPHVSFTKRTLSQSFAYDALGNTVSTDDDAHGFYDRSLGAVTNGTATWGPYQLKAAANVASQARSGALDAVYDDGGNLVSLALRRDGACLPSGASCLQRFVYDWDEVGRLSRGRRWDLAVAGSATDAIPAGSAAADLRYAYDGDNNRTLKTAVDSVGNQRHSVYIFRSLELRRATWTVDDDYERTSSTESAYLFAHGVRLARLYYAGDDVPTLSSGHLHVLFELPDYLGSSSFVVDGATSEVVQATKYQPYGGTESDYRPARWAGYREHYRFTGKEEDVEVGLTYFGQRYLSASLNRWTSPDPLNLHRASDGDLNLYAYVRSRVLVVVDPVGLDGWATIQNTAHAIYVAEKVHIEITTQPIVNAVKSVGAHVADLVKEHPQQAGQAAEAAIITRQMAVAAVRSGSLGPGAYVPRSAGGTPRSMPASTPKPTADFMQKQPGKAVTSTGKAGASGGPKTPGSETTAAKGPNFDKAREAAFKTAGMTDSSKVQFSKVDPKTGTVVEFKGPGGAKVGYDGAHPNSPGPYHDQQHISAQSAGKRGEGGATRENFPYSGDQHPSRPDTKSDSNSATKE
jgi:RHS repeat-associated protein